MVQPTNERPQSFLCLSPSWPLPLQSPCTPTVAISLACPLVFSIIIGPVHHSNPESIFSMLGSPPQFLVTPEPNDIPNFVLCKKHTYHLPVGTYNVQDDLPAWPQPLHGGACSLLTAPGGGLLLWVSGLWLLLTEQILLVTHFFSCSLSFSFLCSLILALCFSWLGRVPASCSWITGLSDFSLAVSSVFASHMTNEFLRCSHLPTHSAYELWGSWEKKKVCPVQ